MKSGILIFAICIFYFLPPWGGQRSAAQQVPLYSQYYLNPFIYNPAYTGINEWANAYLIHRLQWKDMPGGPQTTALTMDAPMKEMKTGVGLSLFNDKTGYTERFGLYGSFGHRVSFSENAHLQFGLSLGALDNRVDFTGASLKDVDDPTLSFKNSRETTVDGNFGIAFKVSEFDLGFSVPQLLGNKLTYEGDLSRLYYQLSRHYLTSIKYTFRFGEEKNISFAPLALIRFVGGAPLQYDINGIFEFKERFGLCLAYKSKYAIGINARLRFSNRLSIGYGYEFITGTVGDYSGLSHEVALGYTFDVMGKGMHDELERLRDEMDSLIAAKEMEELQKTHLFNQVIRRADSLFKAGDYQGATTAYQNALTIKPDSKYAQEKISEIRTRTETMYNKAIAEADKLLAQGKYEEAKAKYQEALKYKPDANYARNKITDIENKYGQQYRNAIASADMFFASKDYKRAKEMYQKALQINPNDSYAKQRLAELDKLLSDQAVLGRMIAAGDSLYMAGKYDEAKAKYQEALKLNPSDSYLRDIIAQIDKKKAGGGGESIRLYKGSDFTDISGKPVQEGFYIVTASFQSVDNAKRFMKTKNTGSIYNKERKFYYCFVKNANSYDEARNYLLNTVRKEVPDSWIFILR
ncbi:MAG: PorP/SprF family type IX secretion system membrane protein [Bacteroidetes bacterium]|nr:PorP/SprF family type IX secretion system membrane protein [Bacteroidota bacterium]